MTKITLVFTCLFPSSILGLSWTGIAALWLIMLPPYPPVFRMDIASALAMRLLPRRVAIARRNLELLPQMKAEEREALLQRNFESVGMGVIETGMGGSGPNGV